MKQHDEDWAQFERAVDAAVKSGPKHRPASRKPLSEKADRSDENLTEWVFYVEPHAPETSLREPQTALATQESQGTVYACSRQNQDGSSEIVFLYPERPGERSGE